MRIFVAPAELLAGELVLRGDEHHYLAYVRRARPGDAVEIVDGAGRRAAAVIARIADDHAVLAVAAPEAIAARPPHITALVPLIKGDRMDTCIEKLVEVGVDAIVVWPAARSVVKLDDDRKDARLAKYRACAQAAARQSGRAAVPPVTAGELADSRGQVFVLDPTSDAPLDPAAATEITIVSGPEGGFTPSEREQLAAATAVGLGPRILRAETAPVVAVAVIRAITRS